MESNRFVVTKCEDLSPNGLTERRKSNMNTIDIRSVTPNARKRAENSVSFETGRQRWMNVDLNDTRNGHNNPLFAADSESEEEFEPKPEFEEVRLRSHSEANTAAKDWDPFENLPPEEEDFMDSKWTTIPIAVMKIMTYVLTFVSLLFCAFLSYSTLLLMTSMIRRDQKVILCTNRHNGLIPGLTYVADFTHNRPEKIGWVWCLFAVMSAPLVLTFYRCLKFCLFKNYQKPKLITFLSVFLSETLNTIGLVLLVVMVLPNIELSLGPKLSHSICLLPAILAFVSRLNKEAKERGKWLTVLDITAIVIQLLALIAWPLAIHYGNRALTEVEDKHSSNQFWAIPVVLILISLGYWDNYLVVKEDKKVNKVVRWLAMIKNDLDKSRYFTYAVLSVWKIIVTFAVITTYLGVMDLIYDQSIASNLFGQFDDVFSNHSINITRQSGHSYKDLEPIHSIPTVYLWVLLVQIFSTIACYVLSKFVCKIQIQVFSFTIPLTLVSPITITALDMMCRIKLQFPCEMSEFLQLDYIFWHNDLDLNDEWQTINTLEAILWTITLFSQLWVTSHIWRPKSRRMAKTENLFMKPEFSSVFIDQSLILNRKIDSELNESNLRKMSRQELEQSRNETVRIYMCATMWHESPDEMVQMLKSVLRMDADQSEKRLAMFYLNAKPEDYYECQTHIFFDDAFEDQRENEPKKRTKDKKPNRVVNSFVKSFIEVIDLAASSVHNCHMKLKTPKVVETPYGGQMIWTLPGQNLLYVHLKDKNQIRHKKRWSQVMYMYYLLGYRFKDKEESIRNIIAENTFILALDGDINFQPKAVSLLVDLMVKQKNLGAACGRIHPIGSGPMVWYQKFEYAIGHWLQKATEHVIGCVLCSPGCFSLFRAKALMSPNVLKKYTSKASEAIQYVQYDQGEDRWLCTLLLQQGWRIEYCAASDSYTHAPEGYDEFYNQRRRWTPSTLFNIWDLLQEYRQTVQVNDNISRPYILYQFCLMVGTVFSPGTIFLMIVGAMNTSFKLSNGISLVISGFPILIFIFICFYTKNDIQIKFSLILSITYALLMLAVIVSTVIEVVQEGIWNPTSLFFFSLILSFLVAAIIHPTEIDCFLPIILYMLCIPSMYLLLTIYSIINLNVISWGTREGPQQQNKQRNESDNKKDLLRYLNIGNWLKGGSSLVSCVCCSEKRDDKEVLKQIGEVRDQLTEVKTYFRPNEDKSDNDLTPDVKETTAPLRYSYTRLSDIEENDVEEVKNQQIGEQIRRATVLKESVSDAVSDLTDNFGSGRPFWAKDKCFEVFCVEDLDEEESVFWSELIGAYLKPLDSDPEHEEKVKFELKELRDKIVAAFGFLNSLFILLVLLLQMHQNIFRFEIIVKENHIKIDVIAISLVIFFGIILVIQFFGMLLHRFNTFSLLLSVTQIHLFGGQTELADTQEVVVENASRIVKQLQKLNSNDMTNKRSTMRSKRPEMQSINATNIRPEEIDLEKVFLSRVYSLKNNNFDDEEILPESKLSRNGRNRTVRGRDVRREIYKKVKTVRRKQSVTSQQLDAHHSEQGNGDGTLQDNGTLQGTGTGHRF